MKGIKFLGTALLAVMAFTACQQQGTSKVLSELTLVNSTSVDYSGVVEIAPEKLNGIATGTALSVINGTTPLTSEWSDKDGDGKVDVLCVDLDIKANSEVKISLAKATEATPAPVKKTQAELWHKTTGRFKEGRYYGGGNFSKFDSIRVPDGFMDHAYYIKYEGPGWESDKVGYRLYLDWRNAVDVFGKCVSEPVLEQVGMDGYESYHHKSDWGMDVLKVGKSLGIGSNGWWDGEKAIRIEKTDSVKCKILSDGNIRSQVQIWYNGWQIGDDKVDVVSVKSIDAGSRMTREHLSLSKPVANICTGIRIEPDTKTIQLQSKDQKWACLATWGKQSLNNDHLGLAVIYSAAQKPVLTQDKNSHVVVFEDSLQEVEYYFLAAWELEKEGIKTEADFNTYLSQQLELLSQPVQVK